MREKWAKLIVLFSGLLVLLLAMVFAFIQNPDISEAKTTKSQELASPVLARRDVVQDKKQVEVGRTIYDQQFCASCHSIAGKGNPRVPLDNVGARRTPEELRDWITGADSLKGVLPESTRNMKQRYKALTEDEMEALVSYLRRLQ